MSQMSMPQTFVHYRWVLVGDVGVKQGTTKLTAAQVNALVQSAAGWAPGRALLIVREDGIVTASFAAARTGKAWIQIATGYES